MTGIYIVKSSNSATREIDKLLLTNTTSCRGLILILNMPCLVDHEEGGVHA